MAAAPAMSGSNTQDSVRFWCADRHANAKDVASMSRYGRLSCRTMGFCKSHSFLFVIRPLDPVSAVICSSIAQCAHPHSDCGEEATGPSISRCILVELEPSCAGRAKPLGANLYFFCHSEAFHLLTIHCSLSFPKRRREDGFAPRFYPSLADNSGTRPASVNLLTIRKRLPKQGSQKRQVV